MLYILKLVVRLGLWIFCEKVRIRPKALLNPKRPTLIVSNHPNSFLDAIIIGAFYQRKIRFLARGDVFENPIFGFLLRSIGMLPVYRAREGREHLHRNENTFEESVTILKNGGIVFIFIEGICLQTHKIQAFKKGASRILMGAHQKMCFPDIHVISLGYNNFRGIGKNVDVNIERLSLKNPIVTPKDALDFNKKVFTIMEKNRTIPKNNLYFKKRFLYFLHLPYYRFIENIVAQKTHQTVFYDSVLFALLLFTYPIVLGVFIGILWALDIDSIILIFTFIWFPLSIKSVYGSWKLF